MDDLRLLIGVMEFRPDERHRYDLGRGAFHHRGLLCRRYVGREALMPSTWNISPGEHLAKKLESANLHPQVFAEVTGWGEDFLTAFLKGREVVTNDVAETLAKCFRTTPETWLEYQRSWDAWQAYEMRRVLDVDKHARWASGFD